MSILSQLIAAIYKVTAPAPPPGPSFGTQSFTYTGYEQTFTVPAGVTELNVKMWGAGGAGGSRQPVGLLDAAAGGGAGSVIGTAAVTPGETLGIVVGQGGRQNNTGSNNPTSYGGGGLGWGGGNQNGGGGGGLSSLYRGDFYYPNTSALLHMNGLYGSTSFIDNSINNLTVTNNGNSQIRTDQSAYSNQSVAFDGSGDRLSVPDNAAFDLSGDFTVEAWVYFNNTSDMGVCSGSSVGSFDFAFVGGEMRVGRINTNWDSGANFSRTPGIWYHVAWCRSGSTLRFFVNGQIINTLSNSITYEIAGAGSLIVGASGTSDRYFNGFISNLRIVKGVALYTTAFTPSTSPLTAVTGTSLLTCQSNRFIDNSSNNFTVTAVGEAAISGSNPYSNQSVYFNASQYLVFPAAASNEFNFGTGDWTIEAWVYKIAAGGGAIDIIVGNRPGGFSAGQWYLCLNGSSVTFDYRSPLTSNNAISGTLNTNSWYHVAVVRNGVNYSIYVNGILAQTTTLNPADTIGDTGGLSVGGAVDGNYKTNGYISNLRIVKGTALYTSNFTPSTVPLTAISGTSLLTCQSNSIKDNSANNFSFTNYGNTGVSSINPFDTSGSGYFNGTNQYIKLDPLSSFYFVDSPYTIEAWIYPTAISPQNRFIFSMAENETSSFAYFYLGILGDGRLAAYVQAVTGVTGSSVNSGATTVSLNQWTHVAFVRNGENATLYINGVNVGSVSNWLTYPNAKVQHVAVGAIANGYSDGSQGRFQGYIDELRITKGVARYLNNFTSPVAEFPDPLDQYFDNVSLLLHMSGSNGSTTFTDNSPVSKTITVNGSAQINTSQSKFGGGSAYFDGTGTNLLTPDNSAFDFGSGDFTVECWVYIAANSPLDFDSTRGISLINSFGTVTTLGWALTITGNSTTTGTGIGFDYWNPTTNASGTLNRTTTTVNQNQWNHIAATRSSGTLRIFLNGVSLSITTSNVGAGYSEANCSAEGLRIGATINTSYPLPLNGYIDELRITKGVARYTDAFNPPNREFADSNGFIAIAAGGGGGGSVPTTALGGVGGGTTGGDGVIGTNAGPGLGGTQIAGGAAATASSGTPTPGSLFTGGNAAGSDGSGGGGGAGYYGGGGGGGTGAGGGGGGGGSSYTGILTAASTESGSGTNPGNTSDSVRNGAGSGGVQRVAGSDGFVYLQWGTLTNQTFSYTGYAESFTVPSGVTSLNVNMWGAGGGSGGDTSSGSRSQGGAGGFLKFTTAVTAGETLTAQVGGGGLKGSLGQQNRRPGTGGGMSSIVRGDPFYSDVALLLHMNGTNGSTTFTDSSTNPKTFTVVGSAQINIGDKKYGTGSLYLPDTNAGIYTTGLNLDSIFTIEGWVKSSISGSEKFMISQGINQTNGFLIALTTTEIRWRSNGTQDISASISQADWYHFAIVSNGSGSDNIKVYVNGTQVTQGSYPNSITSAAGSLYVGNGGLLSSGFASYGYIDDFRITNGVARYLANFTPPTAEFPDPLDQYFDNNSLLLHMNGSNGSTTFTDSSSNNLTVTRSGTTTISTAQSKFSGSSLRIESNNSLNVQASTSLTLTGDFTIEFWINLDSYPSSEGYAIGWTGSQYIFFSNNGRVGITSTTSIQTNINIITVTTWHHVAICRSGSTTTIFVDGISRASSTGLGNLGSGSSPIYINAFGPGANGANLTGYMDDIRITKDVARYTAAFNPPNREFANGNGIVAIVGAGGGGGGYGSGNTNSWGGSGGDTTANAGGAASVYATGGGAGTPTAGGAAGTPGVGLAGSYLQGGAGAGYNLGTQTLGGWPNGGIAVAIDERGGGGGGGYYGGGGGGGDGTWGAGGGGGSSYTGTGVTAITHAKATQNTVTAPGNTESGYVAGVAVGGQNFVDGGNGLIYIGWTAPTGIVARYWRINVTANNGSLYVSVGEMFLVNDGVDLDTSGKVYTASADIGSTYGPAGAFNGNINTSTYWGASASVTQWLQIDMGTEVVVDQIDIGMSTSANPAESPRDFSFQYSNDGTTWTVAKTFTNQTSWTLGARRTFSIYP